jgi:hypothetical protein
LNLGPSNRVLKMRILVEVGMPVITVLTMSGTRIEYIQDTTGYPVVSPWLSLGLHGLVFGLSALYTKFAVAEK